MAKFYCVVVFGVAAAVIGTVSSLSDEDRNAIKADIIPILAECGKQYDITKDAVIAAKKAKDVDALNPCFYACFLKKKQIIDEEGNYAPEVAKAEHAKFIHDDAELVIQMDAISDACTVVNEKPVTDGAEGCDRAKLIVECLLENKDVFATIFKE